MAHPFDIEIVAADPKVWAGPTVSVVVPAVDGYLGILSGHAPLVAALGIGEVVITPPGNESPVEVAVSGGFVRVDHDTVTILADTAELVTQIDIERAEQARVRAEERLREHSADIDFDRAQAALLRALNRLRIVRRGG
jgi:F-type H+-transporting ATPase subunit epsilon